MRQGDDVETPTQTLHRITSYAEFDEDRVWQPPVDDPRVVTSFEPNDIEHLPWFYKRYPEGLPTTALPRDLPRTSAPAVDVLAGAAQPADAKLDLAQLARILHLCSGVVRTSQRRYGAHLFRAAGSAGGRFPLEVYVAVPEGGELPAGVHWYHPQDHALVTIAPPPSAAAPTMVVTGVPWRTGWRYRERGYRHIHWDAGTMLSQALAAAASAGVPTRLFSRFPDASVTALVGADGVDEWPVALVAFGPGDPAIAPAGEAAHGEVDAAPLRFPLVTSAQRAGDRDELGQPWPAGGPIRPAAQSTRTVDDVVLARGSQRLMDPNATLPADVLLSATAVAMRGIDVGHWVAVHGVDGVTSGLYRLPDLDQPVRAGNLREELYRFCMDQGLGRDAAFVVVSATDITQLDDRAYREAQLAAGLVEGRLHLAAYGLGATASGMTFVDGLVPELLGEPLAGLLVTCVGVGEYTSRAGGAPGAPTEVGMVTPRF
jgi:SagB-type dehydrogenase family enzyme